MLKRIFKILGIVVLMAYLAVCGFSWRIGNKPMVIRDIKVVLCDSDAAEFFSPKDVVNTIVNDGTNPIGKQADRYDMYGLKTLLERKHPLMRKVDVYPTPDSLLRIDIYQRLPLMRIKSSQLQGDFYLDTDGKLMRYKRTQNPIQVPLVTGEVTTEMAENDIYQIGLYLRNHEFWRNAITQIHVGSNGEIRLIPRVGDHTIILGDADRLEEKLDNLKLFYKKVLNKKGWNKYKTINLKFKGQVVAEKQS